ncbi:glycosyltransferase family 2 protein [Cellulomonas citrea]|uniref:glycosyltransferase family 2 protein n=1 Tax=Cellulomonas citrea TaxID=1909423 RepID=UPI003F69F4E2
MPNDSTRRVLVVVPAWNEEQTVGATVAEILAAATGADVVVVNDGSTDATSDVARSAGAAVLDLPINLGVGGAMRAGYRFALRHGYDIAIQVDADGQHDPAEIGTLLEAMDRQKVDIMIGARFAGVGDYDVHGPRRWTMRLLSSVLSRVARTRLTDTTSGFKASNRAAITLFAADYPAEYLGDTIESLVIASRAGLRVGQVGVSMRPRAGGQPSHRPFRAAVFLGRAALALLIALSRPVTAGAASESRA